MSLITKTITTLIVSLLISFNVFAAKITVTMGGDDERAMREHYRYALEWAEENGHEIGYVYRPASATDTLNLYQQICSSGSSDIDIFMIDVIWPGIFADCAYDLNNVLSDADKADFFDGIVGNNTVGGKYVAVPYFTDAGLLYYRKDLLDKYGKNPPTSWSDLAETAQFIQDKEREAGNSKMWGYVWQGNAYEGLTCDGIEWVNSFGGGNIIEADGTVSINNPNTIAALNMAKSWVGTISPEDVVTYQEEEARGVWQTGNAVFMRNWPYAWSRSQADDSPIKDKVGTMALPGGGAEGKMTGALGGWQLMVNKGSKNPEIAADLIKHMTSAEVMKQKAIDTSNLPTRPALYDDPDVKAANPFFGTLFDTFNNAVARPSTVSHKYYGQVSSIFFNEVHSVLTGSKSADDAAAAMEKDLKALARKF